MSEFINNTEQEKRVKRLLEFTSRAHDGEPISDLADEYRAAIHSVRPYDVLVIEHTMLERETSVQRIKDNIEPILDTFRPALESYDWEIPDEGHPLHTLVRENERIETHLDTISEIRRDLDAVSGPPLDEIGRLQEEISALQAVDRHYVRKENELFPHLEEHLKHDRPLQVMWSLHDDIRSHLQSISELLENPGTDVDTVTNLLERLDTFMRGMIFKENHIVYPVAASTLTEDEWTTIQRESVEIGYFEIDPDFAYLESDPAENADEGPTPPAGGGGELPAGAVELGFETGTLTLEEIQLVFDSLPVDVTYVDENDRVRYFNNPDDRIFPRSGSIIGRTVQNCHPPESVDKVEEILSAFRSGTQDRARFWIQNDDAFVVIEYFALRDGGDRYRGTLEVTQEVSDLRGLEDEQRLVDWGE